ncbi:MAG: hypothetical protein GYB67_19250 [Chloroflexi bacterium]|nr:hypothetical protein [Chloroflexota bacterium]
MRALRAIGSFIKNFMILFSFIVNLVLVIVLLVAGLLLTDINSQVLRPLIAGLHSSFVGLDESTIDWTIPVRDRIPVQLTVPLQTETTVTLTEAVPLAVVANITLPGVGVLNNATVNLSLPRGLDLPVNLDLLVPIDEQLDVSLDVRAVIPLRETQLHDPVNNLRLLLEPVVRALYNAPEDLPEAVAMVGDLLAGNPPDLLADNAYSLNPWPGYSRTAGFGYDLLDEEVPFLNRPLETGIVAVGGIPALDEQLRPEVYVQGGPEAINEAALQRMDQRRIGLQYFDGSFAATNFGLEAPGTLPSGLLPTVVPPAAPPLAPDDPGAGDAANSASDAVPSDLPGAGVPLDPVPTVGVPSDPVIVEGPPNAESPAGGAAGANADDPPTASDPPPAGDPSGLPTVPPESPGG